MAKTANPERSESRKAHIREAALRCFKRHGFHRAGMAEICAEAGMSPGNLYRYYQGKEAIIAAIAEEECARYAGLIASATEYEDIVESLLAVADVAFTDKEAAIDPRMALEINTEAMRNPAMAEIVKQFDQMIIDDSVQALKKAQKAGQIDAAVNVEMVTLLIHSTCEGLMYRMPLVPEEQHPQIIAAYKQMVRQLLAPTHSTPKKKLKP